MRPAISQFRPRSTSNPVTFPSMLTVLWIVTRGRVIGLSYDVGRRSSGGASPLSRTERDLHLDVGQLLVNGLRDRGGDGVGLLDGPAAWYPQDQGDESVSA